MGPSKEAVGFFKRYFNYNIIIEVEKKSNDSIKFNSIGEPVPNLYNPSDHYIKVLAILPNTREECLKKSNVGMKIFLEIFQKSLDFYLFKRRFATNLKEVKLINAFASQ
jgi:hypothetical protein